MKMKPLLCAASVVRNFLNVEVGSWPARPIDSSKSFQWQDRRPGKIQCKEYTGLGVEYSKHATKGWQAVATYDAYPGQGTARHGICTSPVGQGDVLYVRESFATVKHGARKQFESFIYRADGDVVGIKWKPSLHMSKWASRIHLEVMRVRVERACDITWEDAFAEGMKHPHPESAIAPTEQFRTLWLSIYGPDAWEKWVWVYDLKRIK